MRDPDRRCPQPSASKHFFPDHCGAGETRLSTRVSPTRDRAAYDNTSPVRSRSVSTVSRLINAAPTR